MINYLLDNQELLHYIELGIVGASIAGAVAILIIIKQEK